MKRNKSMREIVRQAFRESGLSMKALSDRSGVPYSSVHGMLTAGADVSISTIERVAPVLGLELVAKPKRKG